MADELEDLGANVILLNTQLSSGKYVIQDRVADAKAKNAQVYLSIHCNSSPSNSSAVGTEVYYFNDYSKNLGSFAVLVHFQCPEHHQPRRKVRTVLCHP